MRFLIAGTVAVLGVWVGWLALSALLQPPLVFTPPTPAPAEPSPGAATSPATATGAPPVLGFTFAPLPAAATPAPQQVSPEPTAAPTPPAPPISGLAAAILDFIDAQRAEAGQPAWERDAQLNQLAERQAVELAAHFQATGDVSLSSETLDAAFAGSPFICSDQVLAMPRWERVATRDGVIVRREGDQLALPWPDLAERVAGGWSGNLANPARPIPDYYTSHGVGLLYDPVTERLFVAYVYCILINPALQPNAADTPAAGWLADVTRLEQATYEALNAYRQSHGLAPLQDEPAIADIARAHSRRMAEVFDERGLVHSSQLEGDTFAGTPYICGENILTGPRSTSLTRVNDTVVERKDDLLRMDLEALGRELAQRWIDSPPHEKNLRGEYYTLDGVGVYYEQATERLFATHNLCYPR